MAHFGKPVSVRLLLTTVKGFSSKGLIVKRSTKQNFFQPSVGCGNDLISPFSYVSKKMFQMLPVMSLSYWVVTCVLLWVSGVREGQKPSLRIPCPFSDVLVSSRRQVTSVERLAWKLSKFSKTPCFFFLQGSNALS